MIIVLLGTASYITQNPFFLKESFIVVVVVYAFLGRRVLRRYLSAS